MAKWNDHRGAVQFCDFPSNTEETKCLQASSDDSGSKQFLFLVWGRGNEGATVLEAGRSGKAVRKEGFDGVVDEGERKKRTVCPRNLGPISKVRWHFSLLVYLSLTVFLLVCLIGIFDLLYQWIQIVFLIWCANMSRHQYLMGSYAWTIPLTFRKPFSCPQRCTNFVAASTISHPPHLPHVYTNTVLLSGYR